MKTVGIRCVPQKIDDSSHWDLYSMYVVLQGVEPFTCVRVYVQIPLGSCNPRCLKLLNWNIPQKTGPPRWSKWYVDKKCDALLINQAAVTSDSQWPAAPAYPLQSAHTTLTAAPSSSTLQRHPPKRTHTWQQHRQAAPGSGTLQRHQHARSKTQTCNSSYTWSKNPNSFANWEKCRVLASVQALM